jgi:hypothetical protein
VWLPSDRVRETAVDDPIVRAAIEKLGGRVVRVRRLRR